MAGSLLIGADGINSLVRQQLFPESKPQHCGYYYWQGVGNSSYVDNDTTSTVTPAFEAWGPGIRFGMVPLQHPQNFWFVCSDVEIPQEELTNAVRGFGTSTMNLVENTPMQEIFRSELRDVFMSS